MLAYYFTQISKNVDCYAQKVEMISLALGAGSVPTPSGPLLMSVNVFASQAHYVAANRSDSNAGISKTAARLHAPVRPNCTASCASYTPNGAVRSSFAAEIPGISATSSAVPYAGSGCCGRVIPCSRSSDSQICWGLDQNWSSSSFWTRSSARLIQGAKR